MSNLSLDEIAALVREVPDFPKPGVIFKDITPVLADGVALRSCITQLVKRLEGKPIDCVVGIESRGFIFGTALATSLGTGFIPVRKPGKLPREVASQSYALEYGEDTVQIHKEDVTQGLRVVVVDDLIATGGTAAATCKLLQGLGADVIGALFVIELDFLQGRKSLEVPVESLIHY